MFILHRDRYSLTLSVILHQCCHDASDTSIIENNEVAPEWGFNPFWSNSIIFNERSVAGIIAAWWSIEANAQCKQALTLIPIIFWLIYRYLFLSWSLCLSRCRAVWTRYNKLDNYATACKAQLPSVITTELQHDSQYRNFRDKKSPNKK